VPAVQVGVPDGEAPLERHGEEQRHGGQAEEGHADAEVRADAVRLGRHPHQGHVQRVGHLHQRADEAGARQVGDHQRRDEDVEQRTAPRVAGPPVSAPADFQDHQGGHVAEEARGEHDGADQRAHAGVDVERAVAQVEVLNHRVAGNGRGSRIRKDVAFFFPRKSKKRP